MVSHFMRFVYRCLLCKNLLNSYHALLLPLWMYEKLSVSNRFPWSMKNGCSCIKIMETKVLCMCLCFDVSWLWIYLGFSVCSLQDYENFISYICKAYKGNKAPSACAKYTSGKTSHRVKVKRSPLVCRKGVSMWDWLEHIKTSFLSRIDITGLL